jgi:selenium metabolism protein YedF
MDAIDCRGQACPQPVLQTKEALDRLVEGTVTILVDDPAARENVKRFAESQGGTVSVETSEGGGWRLVIAKARVPAAAEGPEPREEALPSALLVTSDQIGPEAELGHILMRAFLATLPKAGQRPAKVLFLNRGIHLTTEGSQVLDILEELRQSGVEVLSCGTCLEFFGKRDSLRVGRVSNMYETVETLTGRYRVVTIS